MKRKFAIAFALVAIGSASAFTVPSSLVGAGGWTWDSVGKGKATIFHHCPVHYHFVLHHGCLPDAP